MGSNIISHLIFFFPLHILPINIPTTTHFEILKFVQPLPHIWFKFQHFFTFSRLFLLFHISLSLSLSLLWICAFGTESSTLSQDAHPPMTQHKTPLKWIFACERGKISFFFLKSLNWSSRSLQIYLSLGFFGSSSTQI